MGSLHLLVIRLLKAFLLFSFFDGYDCVGGRRVWGRYRDCFIGQMMEREDALMSATVKVRAEEGPLWLPIGCQGSLVMDAQYPLCMCI